ncbi:TonB-dependent receptor [Gilvimarinus sp. F26214L]|uniref:TonB-dependent receptor n=1 Tax=Gilvimarinus sp. DZF01 TaxID=3461371 RepID=UPI0040454103
MFESTRNNNRIRQVRRLSLATAIAIAGQAQAQTSVLEEIVVTARKVEENLQETPVAVSAFTGEALARRQINSTDDLDAITPNLQFTSYSPLSGSSSAAQVFIRGIGQSDSSGGVDPGVGLYIDDVYMGRSVGGVMDFRDIANVQVLRGPQGTLFGRNTIGGAVLLSTRAPGNEFGGSVRVGMGDDNLREFFGALDLPVNESVAARMSLGARKRDGYVERIHDGLDLGNEDSYTFNGSVHMDLSETLSLIVRGDYSEEDENGSPFVFAAINENAAFPAYQSVNAGCPGATFPPPAVPTGIVDSRCANDATWNLGKYKNGGTTQAESTLENWGLSATLEWELSDALTFKSITAQRELDWLGARDADNTPFVILSTIYESAQEQFSQEFQFLLSGATFDAVMGLFYFDEEVDDLLRVPFGPPGPPAGLFPVDYQRAVLNNENWAAFTQWTFDLTDRLSLSTGVRYTDETKEMGLTSWTAPVVPQPVTPLPTLGTPPDSVADGLLIHPGPYEEDFSKTTGSLSLNFDLSETAMVYLSWSQGFKSGGFNQRYNGATDDNLPTSFDSEEADSIEVGFKSDLTDNLRLNGALFTTDYENMQLTYRAGIVPLLFNAGESSISGAELELTYIAPNELIVEGSLGYLDDEIKEIATIDFSIDGSPASATLGPDNDLPFTPDLQASLSVSKRFSLAGNLVLTPHLNWSWQDAYYFDTGNTEEVATDAESMVNLSFRLGDDAEIWNVVLGVENATDNQYPIAGNAALTSSSGYAEAIYTRPRNYYLSATYNF